MRRRSPTRKPPQETRTSDLLPVRSVSETHAHRSFTFFGRSGTGKTTLAATFPKPLLLIDVSDEGTDSISDVAGIDVLAANTWDEFERAYWWLKQNPDHYKTVVIDTVTQLQQAAIAKVLGDRNKDTEAKGWGAVTKQEWGLISSLMKTWIINVRDLPLQSVFLAQDRVFNMDEDNDRPDSMIDPEVGPRLSPSVAAHLNAAVSVIGCTFIRQRFIRKKVAGKTKEVERIEYCLRIGPNPVYITKIRKPKEVELPGVIANPDYEDLMELIRGGK